MYIVPPWVPTVEACLTQAAKPHTFSLATVTKTGFPRVRTCVNRGWLFDDKSTGVLLFTTDARSQKALELGATGGVFEACFYFPGKPVDSEYYSRRNSSTESIDSSSNSSTRSDSSHRSHKKPNPGIQIRLSGFAQTISPARGWYPTMIPVNRCSNHSPSPNNDSSASLSSSSSSSTHISFNPNQDPLTYPIYSPNYVSAYRAQAQMREEEDCSPTHSQSGLFDGTGNIIPIPKDKICNKPAEFANGSSNISSNQPHTTSTPGTTHTNINTNTTSQCKPSQPSSINTKTNQQFTPIYPPPCPSHSEWDAEYTRIWSSLSPTSKSSFRRPNPGAALDEESRRQLDKLVRGVDGASDEKGLSNFVLVAMFVNDADVLVDGIGSAHRRNKAHRVLEDDWEEEEVCP